MKQKINEVLTAAYTLKNLYNFVVKMCDFHLVFLDYFAELNGVRQRDLSHFVKYFV